MPVNREEPQITEYPQFDSLDFDSAIAQISEAERKAARKAAFEKNVNSKFEVIATNAILPRKLQDARKEATAASTKVQPSNLFYPEFLKMIDALANGSPSTANIKATPEGETPTLSVYEENQTKLDNLNAALQAFINRPNDNPYNN